MKTTKYITFVIFITIMLFVATSNAQQGKTQGKTSGSTEQTEESGESQGKSQGKSKGGSTTEESKTDEATVDETENDESTDDDNAQGKSKGAGKELTAPSNIGHSGIDNFVAKSFEIYDNTFKTDKDIAEMDSLINTLKVNEKSVSASKRTEMKRTMGNMYNNGNQMEKDLVGLATSSVTMVETATGLTPKTKSLKAVKNINKAKKANNYSRKKVPEQIKKIAEQRKIINQLIP